MWKAAAALLATRQGTGTGSGRARLLRLLGMAGGAGLLAFAAAELLVRSFPAYLPAEILRALHEQAMAANDPASLSHDHLGYVWRPHHKDEFTTGDFRFSYATDEHGFRNPTPWPDQASVVVLGDSQAFAFGVDDERSWVRLLGQRLPGRHVVNLGIIGAAPQQFRRVYQTYGARLRPEVVLVAFSPSNVLHSARLFDEWLAAGKPDRFDARRSRDLFADGEAGGLTGKLRSYLGRSHAIRLLHHVLTGGGGASVTVEGDDGRVHLFPGRRERAAATAAAGSEDFERVIEILRELHDEVRATGGEMLAVPFPSKEEVHLPLLGRQPASLVAPFIAAFERLDIPHVDLTPVLQERIAGGERLFFEVDMHPNVAGYRLIADALADHLRRYVAPAPDPDAGPHRMSLPGPGRAAAPPDPLRQRDLAQANGRRRRQSNRMGGRSRLRPAPAKILIYEMRSLLSDQGRGSGYRERTAMALVKLRRAAQITLPREIRDAARISEGDYLEASVTEDGILLTPVSVGRREPTPAEEAEIQAVVDEERKAYAAERRR